MKILFFVLSNIVCLYVNGQHAFESPYLSFKNWAIGTSSGVLKDFSYEELQELKRNGITYLELSSGIFSTRTREESEIWCKEFKLKAEKAGIEVWSIHLPFGSTLDPSSIDSIICISTIKKLTEIICICRLLNPKKFVIHASSEPIELNKRNQRIEKCISSLKIINEEVKKQGSQLTVECLPRTCLGNTSSELIQIVSAVGNGIGICFDSNHLLKEKPEEFVANVGSLISTVHMSDYDGIDEKHWLPGKGIINWNEVIYELTKTGYKGPFLFEVSSSGTTESSAKILYNYWGQLKIEYLGFLKIKNTSS